MGRRHRHLDIPAGHGLSAGTTIERCVAAAGERAMRAANGLEQVRARFSWSAAARQVVGLYEEVAR